MTYILNRVECYKKMTIKDLKKLYSNPTIDKFYILKNIYCSMKHQKRKDLLLSATKLIEKYLIC